MPPSDKSPWEWAKEWIEGPNQIAPNGNCFFCGRKGHTTKECAHLVITSRTAKWKPVKGIWVNAPWRNMDNPNGTAPNGWTTMYNNIIKKTSGQDQNQAKPISVGKNNGNKNSITSKGSQSQSQSQFQSKPYGRNLEEEDNVGANMAMQIDGEQDEYYYALTAVEFDFASRLDPYLATTSIKRNPSTEQIVQGRLQDMKIQNVKKTTDITVKRSNRPNQDATRADKGHHEDPDRDTHSLSDISPDTHKDTRISQPSHAPKIPPLQQKKGQGQDLPPPQVQSPKDPELRDGRIFPQAAPNPPSMLPTMPEDQNVPILQPLVGFPSLFFLPEIDFPILVVSPPDCFLAL
ncbi:hypothetical protein PDE_06594 [Penicillium oxalicum 114-2]|uniref:CCHC-type domain-containing protein n=1 Tax=Penicillium oxalicum (strain 114-2 / CGMCC 5302) TaxID=933388 RepID=S7ZMQ9_PENO1|nr:hypothetical protein PDE_06594 [Penicillium oxalicum 114-2]